VTEGVEREKGERKRERKKRGREKERREEERSWTRTACCIKDADARVVAAGCGREIRSSSMRAREISARRVRAADVHARMRTH
jgi:hypothetical protein